MNHYSNPPEYNKPKTYSIYVKTEGYVFKDYFLFISNEDIVNIKDDLIINNIEHDLAFLIYNYIKNKYGKINIYIGRTHELFLKYDDIKNIFHKIKNDIMMKNLSKYGNITNDKNLLILTFLKGIKHITYLYLFKMIDGDNIKTSLNEAKTNLDSNEIIYKYWVSDNSNLTYHYMVQKYSNTKSNILSLDIKQASGIIVAFFENIT